MYLSLGSAQPTEQQWAFIGLDASDYLQYYCPEPMLPGLASAT